MKHKYRKGFACLTHKNRRNVSCYAVPQRPCAQTSPRLFQHQHNSATVHLCISMPTVYLLKHKSAQAPISRSDQTSSSPCSQTSFCNKSILPQSVSIPTRFCPNTLLIQRPLSQSSSAPVPSCSTHSASKCLKLNVPLLQSPL